MTMDYDEMDRAISALARHFQVKESDLAGTDEYYGGLASAELPDGRFYLLTERNHYNESLYDSCGESPIVIQDDNGDFLAFRHCDELSPCQCKSD